MEVGNACLKFLTAATVFSLYLYCQGQPNQWDYILFSQKWPISFCIQYIGEGNNKISNSSSNPTKSCFFSEDKYQWTIHGVWPSRYNGKNPFFCNKSAIFDIDAVAPLKVELEKFWPNLEGDKSVESLWVHEWLKHGTCMSVFEPMDNERKYFEGGLQLYKKYNITSLLRRITVLPDSKKEYNVMNIINGIQKELLKLPYISCFKELKSGKIYLSEIRLCFNKELKLIDCEYHMVENFLVESRHAFTNCPFERSIVYPSDTNHLMKKSFLTKKKKLAGKFLIEV